MTQADSLRGIDSLSGNQKLRMNARLTPTDSVRLQPQSPKQSGFSWYRYVILTTLCLVLISVGSWQIWRIFRKRQRPLPGVPQSSASANVAKASLSKSKGWIGKYKIITELDQGGMGRVVKAQHPHLKRPVVIKSILPEFIARPDMRQRLLQEANILFELDHPHIVHVTDLIQEGEQLYIVMQFIDGQNLKQLLQKNGPFPAAEAVRLLIQAGTAMSYLHARGIIHRDIKPQNIMLEQSTNQVKLVDFGIVKPLKSDAASQLTSSSRIAGTPAYMSPEQLLNDDIDTRSDIFSAGIVLYEILAGFNPFEKFQTSVIQAILEKNPLPLNQVRTEISQALAEICAQMLKKDRTQRYQTADTVVRDLSDLAF
jgi:serine/threonine protein kinase